MKKNSKGMTLVELLVGLSITSILMGAMYSVYISNFKSITKTEVKGVLQSEAQVIQRVISDIGMQSQGISKISIENDESENVYYDVDFIDMNIEVEEGTIKTYRLDIDTDFSSKEKNKSLTLKQIDNSLYDNKVIKEWDLSKNIESFKVKPIGTDNFEDAKSIDTQIVLKYKYGFTNEDYKISTIISFRNKAS